MRAPFIFLCAFALVARAPRAHAETWATQSAQTFEGQLSGVYGSIAVVASPKGGTTLFSVDQLDDPSLVKVADALDKAGKEPPTWAASTGKVAKSLRHRLQILKEGKLVDFDPGTRPEPELYLVYFGAHWCRPCREFSPHLVQEYQRLRELAAPTPLIKLLLTTSRSVFPSPFRSGVALMPGRKLGLGAVFPL